MCILLGSILPRISQVVGKMNLGDHVRATFPEPRLMTEVGMHNHQPYLIAHRLKHIKTVFSR